MRRTNIPPARTVRHRAARRAGSRAIRHPAWHCFTGARRGVTSIEYAIMGAFIMVAIAASVGGFTGGLGSLMKASFGHIAAAM